MSLDHVIRGGRLVVPHEGVIEADVGIAGEKIVQIGGDLPDTAPTIDATGMYVFPGVVDTHTHYGHFNEFYSEMETESDCLASLGVTTSVILIDRCVKNMDGWIDRRHDPELFTQADPEIPGLAHAFYRGSFHHVLPEAIRRSEQHSANDFAFHLGIVDGTQVDELDAYHRVYGVASFKCWTNLYPWVACNGSDLLRFLDRCRRVGVLPYVNTVNSRIRRRLEREAEVGRDPTLPSTPGFVKESQGSPLVETVDLEATLEAATEAESPELCIVHVSAAESVDLIRRYRSDDALDVVGEAAAVWLDLSWPEVGDRLGHQATCIIPQLGDEHHVDALWDGIRTGDITVVGSDGVISPTEHFPDGSPNPLYRPPPTRDRQGVGFPSHICYFPILLDTGLARGFTPVEIAEISAANPARLMRLFPKKGTIAVGSDADLVVVDPEADHVIRLADLPTVARFNPWEGRRVAWWPKLTMLRGTVIFEAGRATSPRIGRYLPRLPDRA